MIPTTAHHLTLAASPIDCVFRLDGRLLLVETHGWRSHVDPMIDVIRQIVAALRGDSGGRILWRDFCFGERTSLTDAYRLGGLITEISSAVAFVPSRYMQREEYLMSQLIHVFAANRGYGGRVCRCEEEARNWLAALPVR